MKRSTNNRKGILFLLPQLYPSFYGGIEIFHYYFVNKISQHFNVYVCTGSDKFKGGNNIHVYHYPYRLFGSHNLSSALNQSKWIYRLKNSIDLIHIPYSSRTPYCPYYVILFKHLLNIPYILRIHGGGMYVGKPAFLHQMWVSQAAAVMTVSKPVKEEYEDRHGIPITVIPSMLPFNTSYESREALRSKYGVEKKNLVVLFVGSIKDIKGPDLLLKVFLEMEMPIIERYNLKLVFAGDGDMRQRLETEAAGSQLSDRISFLGRVPHEKICEVYKMADIFCIPSVREARPLSLAEALYNGLPAIGSDIDTIRNIISDGKNGLTFKQGDSESLRQALLTLIENSGKRCQMGVEARHSYLNFFDYDKMIDDYCEFYNSVINV